jgi:hypothetical protein
MKLTTFFAALALVCQTACAQSGGAGSGRREGVPTTPPAVGGGGFGGGSHATILTDGQPAQNTYADYILLNSPATTRPTEKGPYLGVGVTPVPAVVRDQLKLQRGVGLVANFVEKGSPADTAGVHENDILTKLDDQVLVNPQQLAVLVRIHKLDEPMRLTVIREAKPMELNAKLVERDLTAWDESGNGGIRQMQNLLRSSYYPTPADPFTGGSFQLESSDDQNSFSVTRSNGHCNVLARNKDGKVLFDGPIDTDEQIEKVPKMIREKVQKLRNWPAKNPSSMPIKSLRILPPTPAAGKVDYYSPRQSIDVEPKY